MSNWMVVGIVGAVTVTCCIIIAKVTGKERKVTLAGIFSLLSAGGFAYAIAQLVREGLSGSYLVVAVLVGIIVPVLVFLTIYNFVKEPFKKGKHTKHTVDIPLSAEKNKKNNEILTKNLEIYKNRLEEEQNVLNEERNSLNTLENQLRKERKDLEEEKFLLLQREEKVVALTMSLEEQQVDLQKENMLGEFEREKDVMEQNFESERTKMLNDMKEEKMRLRFAFVKMKKKLEIEREELKQMYFVEAGNSDAKEELELRIAELEQNNRNLNNEKREMSERFTAELITVQQNYEKCLENQKIEEKEEQKLVEKKEDQLMQETKVIESKEKPKLNLDDVLEKGRVLQKKGLGQFAITLYEEYYENADVETQKQLIIKEMADYYMDSGEPGKAKRLLAKR